MNVPRPVIPPRTNGLPRPVSSPVSDRPSENAIEIAGADRGREAGDEARRTACALSSATEKIGASVESEPSISPTIAGWTRWSRKLVLVGHA